MTPPAEDPLARSLAAPDVAPRPGPDQPDLQVVVARRRRRNWQVGTVAGALLFVALFTVAGFQALIATNQKRIDDLDARIEAEEARASDLDDELTRLESPQRITREATEELGMLVPPLPVYLVPRPDDAARAAQVPEPTPPTTVAPTTTTPTTAPSASAGSATPSSQAGVGR